MALESDPEILYFSRTSFVPNSRLPVLIYRHVLPQPHDEQSAQELLEKNNWMKGGAWGAIPRHHFHPNTHECYAVIRGSSTLLLGVGPNENPMAGRSVHVEAGDIIILPAGVSHCSTDFKDDYFYVGVYPKGSPKWKNEYCRDSARCSALSEEAEVVPIPEWDPVRGYQGPLHSIWTKADAVGRGHKSNGAGWDISV